MTLVSTPDNPIPAGAIAGTIRTSDGIDLRFARWASTAGNRGTVCVFQGRTEFIEKYFETVNDLLKRGFAVATLDWRGQGHSARQLPNPRKGYVKSLAEFEVDADAFMQQVVLANCPPPYFALAHSMGGAALVRVAHSGKQKFERYVLSAPMIDLHGLNGSIIGRAVARSMRFFGRDKEYVKGGDVDGPRQSFDKTDLTWDPVRFARNEAIVARDPSLEIGRPTVAWVNAAYDSIDEFKAADYARKITQPMLIVGARDDTIVSTDANQRFAERLPSGKKRVIDKSRHEILQEKDAVRDQFWAEFDAFIP